MWRNTAILAGCRRGKVGTLSPSLSGSVLMNCLVPFVQQRVLWPVSSLPFNVFLSMGHGRGGAARLESGKDAAMGEIMFVERARRHCNGRVTGTYVIRHFDRRSWSFQWRFKAL